MPLRTLLNRRRALGLCGTGLAAVVAARCGLPSLLRHGPPAPLEPDLQRWVDDQFADVDRAAVWDVHCHLVGRGVGSGCSVSPELVSPLHPWKNFQFDLYAAAAGIAPSTFGDDGAPDSVYVDRLIALHRLANPRGKLVLLAFERHVDDEGREVPEKTELFTPNDYAIEVMKQHPDVVVAGCSVHPYREDAIERLERCLDAGCRAVKWLPNAMNIDPSSPRCDAFFEVLARRKIPLVTHTGDESAVDARDLQQLGDPRRLARALDHGVVVVAAHVATTGRCDSTSCFDELIKMLDEPRWRASLFADISAVPQWNRAAHLPALLRRGDLHARLVNGTDYPLPAIDPLMSTRYLLAEELLDIEDRPRLNAVFAKNPLLFDYLLKRRLRVKDDDGRVHRFAPVVFESRRIFEAAA
jgi:mannonate dehydratase